MRKWKELSKKEKTKVAIAAGVSAVGVVSSAVLFGKYKKTKKELDFIKEIPEIFPMSSPRIIERKDCDPKIRYALQIFYTTEDKSDGRFMAEWAVPTLQDMKDFGQFIIDTASNFEEEGGSDD